MKKLFVSFIVMVACQGAAQNIEVPMFDDSVPNLGVGAKPLPSIVITPQPLPEIRIPLDDKIPPVVSNSKPLPSPAVDMKRQEPVLLPSPTIQPEPISGKIEVKQPEPVVVEKEQILPEPVALPEPTEPEPQTPASLDGLFGEVHDVHGFDIGGFALNMTPEDIVEISEENGYEITKVEHNIPLFRTSYYEHLCQNAGVFRPEALKNCIREAADADEVQYISSITMQRPQTAEYVQVLFSSPATENVSYKIYYENKGDNSLTFTRKNLAKMKRRKETFWNMIFDTYGLPDDNDKLVWGDLNSAYMQVTMHGSAYNAYIVLEDKDIGDRDYFAAEDDAKELEYKHNFTFAGVPEED